MGFGGPITMRHETTPHTRLNRLVETNRTHFGLPNWKLHSYTRISTLRLFETLIFCFRRVKWVSEVRLPRVMNTHLTLD